MPIACLRGDHTDEPAGARSARAHAAAAAGLQGVHASGGGTAPRADSRDHRRDAGRRRRHGPVRPGGSPRLPAAGHRDRRDARRPPARPGPVQGVVERPGAERQRDPHDRSDPDHQASGGRGVRLFRDHHRRTAPAAAGGPGQRAAGRRGGGRPADPRRDAGRDAADPGRRQRDHAQPDRQRHAGAAAEPRRAPAPAGGSGPARLGRRGVAALRQSGPARRPDRAGGRGDRRHIHPRRPAGGGDDRRRPTATRRCSKIRRPWTSDAARRATCPSDAASTTASAQRWPCWRRASPSPACSTGSRRSQVAAEPRYRDNVVLRGLDQLWIEVERA